MRQVEAELISKRSTKFLQSCINNTVLATYKPECSDDFIGGIIKRGQLGWLAQGPLLEIHSLRNEQKISSFRFDHNLGFERCVITCITEINAAGLNCCILAIGILFEDTVGGIIALYSVKESKVVRCIELKEKVTSCQFIDSEISKRTILHMMQGCLAVGTDTGKIFLLDLNLSKCEEVLLSTRRIEEDIEFVPCHIVSSCLEFSHIRQHHKHSKQENINFGIELERVENASLILSMLSLTPLLTLVVGLEDGRMILYDLSELQPFHMAYPPERMSPLVKLAFLEPPDDPRACIYIWAYHENPQTPIAVMHSIMYDKKIPEDDGICLFEGFQCCNVRLTLPMYENGSLPITCQSITKLPTHDDEDMISICLLAWRSKKSSQILIFDINQWYKEEMPSIGDWRDNLNYLAHFTLKDCLPLDVYIDPATVASFNSIQRPEEHFYPISLCFDCTVMQAGGSIHLHWPGLQHRALDLLRYGGPTAILEPNAYFNEVMSASLLPQFSEYNYNSTFSINAQREILLSIALEYNCFGLLRECAKCWADGSYLGRTPNESLSLSTLTEWIWNKAKIVKNRCNILCIPLFDHSGLRIDQRSQKELSHLGRQLKLLADLYNLILKKCKEYIPDSELETLTNQCSSIRMASEYQEVLQWLLNIGLLPEGVSSSNDDDDDDKIYSETPLVPYPYKILKSYYKNQRMRFGKLNKGFISSRTQSCRILYIDSFIEHECNANILRDQWQESGGNGLYPPPSLQAMLRTLLVPDVSIENKYILFIYLFLDLNMAIEDESCVPIVHNLIKFPAVFKLNASLIKTVQAFWNLDHGQFEIALEEIVSPFSQDRKLSQWQQELLIEALLAQDQPNLALQALQARVSPISSLLELKTLLANDLVAEAYHLQRSKHDLELLRTFLNGCLYLGKWGVLRDLALTEEEGKVVEEFLRQTKSSKAENLHFIYLLQRSKYVEAISYLDELSKSKQNQRTVDLETPNLVLSAYNLTMTPATKQVSDTYCNIRNRIKSKDNRTALPMPLSCELLKSGLKDISGGIYHSSAISTDQATIYWDEGIQKETNRLLDANNVPFIRQPQLEIGDFVVKESLSYPEVFKGVSKRRLNESSDMDEDLPTLENPHKRRRIFESSDLILKSHKSLRSVNSSLLTRFKDKTLKDHSLSEKSLNITSSRQDSAEKSLQLLNTPIVKSSRIDFKDDLDTVDSNYQRVCTPQSILKVNMMRPLSPSASSIKTLRQQTISNLRDDMDVNINASINRTEVAEEEKSIRFDLPRRSDITENSFIVEAPPESGDWLSTEIPSTFGEPKKRRPIRTADSSGITISDTDEFFSPIQSRDVSKIEEEMQSVSEGEEMSVEKSKEVQEEPEDQDYIITEKRECDKLLESKIDNQGVYKNINPEIEQRIIENISIENSPLKRRINVTEGPKARRPLKRSNTPPQFLDQPITILSYPDRNTRSRSRSKTPDVSSSPSRRSSRLAEKSEKSIEPRKPLSRMVLEINAKKIITSVSKSTTTISSKSFSDAMEENNKDIQVSEMKEVEMMEMITKNDSLDFKPMASSSTLSKPLSRFQPLCTKDTSQTYKEVSVSDVSLGDIWSTTIATLEAPTQILPDDSILSDSFTQNWKNRAGYDHTMMTTMDMSNFSGDISLETFEPPGNLLSDSESDSDVKKIKKSTPSEIKSEELSEIVVKNNEKITEFVADNIKKTEDELSQRQDKVAKVEDADEQTDEELKQAFVEEVDVISSKDSTTEDEHEEFEDQQSSVESISDEDDFLGQNDSLNYEYSDESSSEYGDDSNSDGVINISSSSDEVTVHDEKEVKEITEKSIIKDIEGKSQSHSNTESKKGESSTKDISDLLYGDIDKEGTSTQDKENKEQNEDDELNDAIILNKSSATITTAQELEEKPKITTDCQSKTDTTTNPEEEHIETQAASESFELEPTISIGEGMTLNFLTGEEEKLDETGEFYSVNKLNEGRLEETSTLITESEISCVDTSASDYKSFAEDKTVSSISVTEVDEDPFQSVNSSKDLLNEQILDDTVKISDATLHSDNIAESKSDLIDDAKIKSNMESACDSSKREENLEIAHTSTDYRRLSIPLLIVSPPEDSENKNQHEKNPSTEFIEKSERTVDVSSESSEMREEICVKSTTEKQPEIVNTHPTPELLQQTITSDDAKQQESKSENFEEATEKLSHEKNIQKMEESKSAPSEIIKISKTVSEYLKEESPKDHSTIQQSVSLSDPKQQEANAQISEKVSSDDTKQQDTNSELSEEVSDKRSREKDIQKHESEFAPSDIIKNSAKVSIHLEEESSKSDEKLEPITVQDHEMDDVKLQVSDDENSVGSENKIIKTSIENLLKSEIPDRNILGIESTTPTSGRLLRSRRARSEDIETNSISESRTLQKLLRATSVPRTDTCGTPKQKKLRTLSESSATLSPSRILTRRQSQILERIEEDNTLDSPSSRTRSRKRINSKDSEHDLSSPTMNKQVRRSPVCGIDTPGTPKQGRPKSRLSGTSQSTPRRTILSTSKENIAMNYDTSENSENSESVEESFEEKGLRSVRRATTKVRTAKHDKKYSGKEEENKNEQKASRSKSKKQEKSRTTSKSSKVSSLNDSNETESSEPEASESDEEIESKRNTKSVTKPLIKLGPRRRNESEDLKAGGDTFDSVQEDLSASRRVTRNQASILEKAISSPVPELRKITRRRTSKTDDSLIKKTDQESEVESVASGRSKRSSVGSKKRSTRSSMKEDMDDNSSIASSTRSRSSIKSKKEQVTKSSAKGQSLNVIHEVVEDYASSASTEEETPNAVKGKRGRTKKSNK